MRKVCTGDVYMAADGANLVVLKADWDPFPGLAYHIHMVMTDKPVSELDKPTKIRLGNHSKDVYFFGYGDEYLNGCKLISTEWHGFEPGFVDDNG